MEPSIMSHQLEKNEILFIQKQQQLHKQSQSRMINSPNRYAPRKQSPLGRDAGQVEPVPQFLSAPPPEPMTLPAEIASIPAERQLFRMVQLQHYKKQLEEEKKKQQSPTTEKPQKPTLFAVVPPIKAPPPTLQQPRSPAVHPPSPSQQQPQQRLEQERNVLHKDQPRPRYGDRKKSNESWTKKIKNIFGLAKDEIEDDHSSAPMVISMPSFTQLPNGSPPDITVPQFNMHLRNASVPNISTQTLHIPSSPDYHIRNLSLPNPNVRVPKLTMPPTKALKLANVVPQIPKNEPHELESPLEGVSPLSQSREESVQPPQTRQRQQSRERNQRQILPQQPAQRSLQLSIDQGELLLPPKQPQFRPFSFEPLSHLYQTEIPTQAVQSQSPEQLSVGKDWQTEVTQQLAVRSPETPSEWSSDHSPEQFPDMPPHQFNQNKPFKSFAQAYQHLHQDTPPESPAYFEEPFYHELPTDNHHHHQPQPKSSRRAIERLLSAGERDLLHNTQRTLIKLNTLDEETTNRLASSGQEVSTQLTLAQRQGSYYDDTEEEDSDEEENMTPRVTEHDSPLTPDDDTTDDTYSISGYSSYSQDTYFQRDVSPRRYTEDGLQDQFLFSPSKHYSFHDLPEWSDVDLGRDGDRYGGGKPLMPLWVASELDHTTGKVHKRNVSNTWVAAYGIELDY
ncbi:MAG: hypothetical protein MMC33_009315 [Icmadophila ericetorum]|nr:hypothetical protein [Icmadophila ericetorum]